MFRLDEKLARIRAGAYRRSDFIIADAKDPDMGPGLHAVGPARERDGSSKRFRTRAEFIASIEAVVRQDIVDIMLTSASNLERLVARDAFAATGVKPAIRANDTTDIWGLRGASYAKSPSRPFRTASLSRVRSGGAAAAARRQDRADRSRALFHHLHQRHRLRTSLRWRRSANFAPTRPPTTSTISSKSSIPTSPASRRS